MPNIASRIASPGAILREQKRVGSPLGVEAEKLTSQGKMVPNELVNESFRGWLQLHQNAFVFDGYPRTAGQADALDELLSGNGQSLDMVVLLEIDLPTIQNRVANRMTCAICGWVGSIGLHVKNANADCPRCGGRLVKRRDDPSETLAARLAEYGEKTEPLISRYRERGILHSVDAGRRPEVVFDSLSKILEIK